MGLGGSEKDKDKDKDKDIIVGVLVNVLLLVLLLVLIFNLAALTRIDAKTVCQAPVCLAQRFLGVA